MGRPRRTALGARWVGVLAARAARVQLLHVHSGTVVAHTRLQPHRADATLLPVPLPVATLPVWAPAERPRVVLASRWETVKGLDTQLEVAAGLRQALGAKVELVGLDWGEGAGGGPGGRGGAGAPPGLQQ